MVKKILVYKNPILRKKSQEVVSFDKSLHTLLDDMYDTMDDENGVGLAAIQIGEPLRVFILSVPDIDGHQDKNDLIEVINPKIISKKEKTSYDEGCLSLPTFTEIIERDKIIEVEFQDRFGDKQNKTFDDLTSIAFQHELDHLNGILFVDKLDIIKRKKFEKEWQRFQKKQKQQK
ncbi:MAG: Peptide deformylase (EC [uncultured Campylobacterales bacterium]|uniref:Peptide deformylase n=1 Tax=uncultured Campylobacterales bacterium TaxID=352960 RepID=A0A6S6T734_9BACT|nr:MAG: Peptide deformylase (EC [uncultured Campylobacterales bacterium]